MKPRIGVYLSEQLAARLAAAAKRPGASKSAIVEAALAQFLCGDDEVDYIPVDRRLSLMSRQLEQLDQNLRIVNETVALRARYQLAVTPPLPAAARRAACELGSERFEEFAAQIGRRMQLGTSLMQETMDRLGNKQETAADGLGREANPTTSRVQEPDFCTSSPVGFGFEHSSCRPGGRQPAQLSRKSRATPALVLLRRRKLLTSNRAKGHSDLDRRAIRVDGDTSAA
jgi:hypothetical protein